MINVKNLNKTYYKGKPNEIKVINNTTLELPNTGLISFLGASGSGKTTLLNTIGGLDKAKGTIVYDDVEINNYKMGKVDAFRSKHIGYIFQNYLLLEHLSVYENLRMALELINITDKDEVNKRIEYSLKAVGLFKFRKKPAGQLSGGQMQRVAIARCLVKKCNIIIADEPTGNLDSENTIEIMNVLKKISKESLVLLVTHNKEIADFYSDRIINIKDGVVVSDETNESSGTLESADNKKIHLLDLENVDVTNKKHTVNLYTDSESEAQNITIVVKNNTVYIESKSRLQIVTGENVKLVNDHYKKVEIKNVDDFNYDRSWYNDVYSKTTILDFFKALGKSFVFFFTDPRRKKLFNFVFSMIGIIMAILVLVQTNYYGLDTTTVINEPNVYNLIDESDDGNFDQTGDIVRGVKAGYITDCYVNASFTVNMKINAKRNESMDFNAYVFPIDKVKNANLLAGAMATKPNTVVIGKGIADRILKAMKLNSYSDLIGNKVANNTTISGVSSVDTNSVYAVNIYNFNEGNYAGTTAFGYYKYEKPKLALGRDIQNDNEIIADKSVAELGQTINVEGYEIAETQAERDALTLHVVGLTDGSDFSYYTNDTKLFNYNKISNGVVYKDNQYNMNNRDNNYNYIEDGLFEYTLVEGTNKLENDQCIISVYSGHKLDDVVNGLRVVGLFIPKEQVFEYFIYDSIDWITNSMIITNKATMLAKNLKNRGGGFYSYVFEVSNPSGLKNLYSGVDVGVYDAKAYNSQQHHDASERTIPVIEAVLLVVIIVYTYFSQRAKMISEVYEIGVIRSLGGKRSKLLLKNVSDNFAKTTLTTLLGYLITILIYYALAIEVNSIAGVMMFSFNPLYVILGIVILYGVQLVVGMIPMITLLRKTPSEINSKYDI